MLNAADSGPQSVAPGQDGVPLYDASGCDLYNSLICSARGSRCVSISGQRWRRAATRMCAFRCWVEHSLNVATAGGVVIYEFLRKYRVLHLRGLQDLRRWGGQARPQTDRLPVS